MDKIVIGHHLALALTLATELLPAQWVMGELDVGAHEGELRFARLRVDSRETVMMAAGDPLLIEALFDELVDIRLGEQAKSRRHELHLEGFAVSARFKARQGSESHLERSTGTFHRCGRCGKDSLAATLRNPAVDGITGACGSLHTGIYTADAMTADQLRGHAIDQVIVELQSAGDNQVVILQLRAIAQFDPTVCSINTRGWLTHPIDTTWNKLRIGSRGLFRLPHSGSHQGITRLVKMSFTRLDQADAGTIEAAYQAIGHGHAAGTTTDNDNAGVGREGACVGMCRIKNPGSTGSGTPLQELTPVQIRRTRMVLGHGRRTFFRALK